MVNRHYSQIYRQIGQDIEARAQRLLGRPLTAHERSGIWNVSSVFMLEAIERDILATRTAEALAETLGALAAQADQQRRHALDSLVDQVASLLQRALSEGEQRGLHATATVYDAICVAERLTQADHPQREALFHQLIVIPTDT
jgi:hypothetical protein